MGKKGKEPAGLKAYRLAKARGKAGTKKRTSTAVAKRKSAKRKGGVVQAGVLSNFGNVAAVGVGAVLAWKYKDHPTTIGKWIEDPKKRYGAIAAVGLGAGVIMKALKVKSPLPTMAMFALLGAGAAGAIAGAPLWFPKLLPGATGDGAEGAGERSTRMYRASVNGMGRIDRAKLQDLRKQIQSRRPSMSGRRGTMTGRRGTMTGTRGGVITGLSQFNATGSDRFSNVWT